MKRAVVMSSLALVCGLLLGWLVGSGFLPPIHVHTNASAISPAVSPGILSNNRYGVSAAPEEEEPLDTEDNTPLLDRAGQALEALKEKNYAALSRLVHPERGVTLTPYSTVDPSCDNVLTQAEVARLSTDEEVYTWGLYDGSGEPIRCTGQEYFDRYVFNADYTEAPQVGIDTVLISGNALENVDAVYEDGRFVEYHFPGIDPAREGFDWCSLKLVFEVWNNDWYLVGMIHGEWTV